MLEIIIIIIRMRKMLDEEMAPQMNTVCTAVNLMKTNEVLCEVVSSRSRDPVQQRAVRTRGFR